MPTRVRFHIIISTYGAWLPGDPRGFRTRHHREHVEGDYQHPPPPGTYERRHRLSRDLLKHAPVVINKPFRSIIGSALRDRLIQIGGCVLIISCGGQHVHIQVQLDDGDARDPIGVAKKHATFVAHAAGFIGKLWAQRCQIVRIRERVHQRNVYRYILDHASEGAWVWSALLSRNEAALG